MRRIPNYDSARLVLSRLEDFQVDFVHRALDTLARVYLGQLPQVFEPLTFSDSAGPVFQRGDISAQELREALVQLNKRLTGVPYGGPGICNEEVPDVARALVHLCDRLEGEHGLFTPEGQERSKL